MRVTAIGFAVIGCLVLVAAVDLDDPLKTFAQIVEDQKMTKKIYWDDAIHDPKYSESCDLAGDASKCPLPHLTTDVSTLITTGGETQCIFGAPYRFQVVRGDSDKLLVSFEGGGACWDEESTSIPLCIFEANATTLTGIFSRNRTDNPFSSYTTINILYCSGDLHAGNVTRPYTVWDFEVKQTGAANSQAVVDWIVAQQESGALAAELDQLVVTGYSAGSLGAQIWAGAISNQVPSASVTIIPDSYVGIFPTDVEPRLVKEMGMCTLPWFDQDLVDLCISEQILIQDLMLSEFKKYKTGTQVLFICSKEDIGQKTFYDSVAITENTNQTKILTSQKFYELANELLQEYKGIGNFAVFFVDGFHHTFVELERVFSSTTGTTTDDEPILLIDWLSTPLASEMTCTECNGAEQSPRRLRALSRGVDYCDTALADQCATPISESKSRVH